MTIVEMRVALDRTNSWGFLKEVKMVWMGNFTWAFDRVINDWLKRKPKQIRNTLPASFTTSTLRYIRITACRKVAPDTIKCEKWSQTDPYPPDPDIPSYPLDMDERKGPYLLTSDYVCDDCKHPCVTNDDLINKLGLAEKKVKFTSRTLQRYMNAEDQMPIDQFRRVIGNAHAQGWLGLWQTLGIASNVDELEATRRSLRAVFSRLMERKGYIERGEIDISKEEIEQEFEKQMRVRGNEITRAIADRLKDKNLPPDIRQFMEESIAPDQAKK
jgi:hypothetical protein